MIKRWKKQYIYLQPKQSLSWLQLWPNPAVPVPATPPLGIAGHTGAGTQRNVPGREPGTRLVSVSQLPEAHWSFLKQHPPKGLSLVKLVKHWQLPGQYVLPGHPKPPATVYIDIKEKHNIYNVS